MPYQVGDRVQVFRRWGEWSRVAIGEVVEATGGKVKATWAVERRFRGLKAAPDIYTETFGPRGGGNEDWRIKPYTKADQAADEAEARRAARVAEAQEALAQVAARVATLSEKELRGLVVALRPFRG